MVKYPKRPKDPVSRAVLIGRILVGEAEDNDPNAGKNANAQKIGAKGGQARARSLSAAKRSEIARKAAAKRWKAD